MLNEPTVNGIELPVLQPDRGIVDSIHGKPDQPRPGRGRTRAMVLFLVHLLILTHIAHFFISGRSLSPVEPSESMYTIELGQLNAGAILFGLAIVSTVIFGRFFCGWGCHLVALQDLSGYLMQRIGLRPKPLRSRLLAIIPFALAFYMFLWPTVKRLWRGQSHPGFTNHLMTENFWYTFPGPVVSILTFAVCGGVIVYLLGNKGFCNYACPYGAFFAISDRLAFGRIRVTDACHQCGQCTAHCTSNVQIHAEVRDYGMVIDPSCMKCLDCVSVCPNDALYFGLSSPSSPRDNKWISTAAIKPLGKKRNYDFSMKEEIVGLLVAWFTVYSIRGLYDITPLLLSVAMGVITAFLTLHVIRLYSRRDLRLQRIQIKRSGKVTRAGAWMVVCMSVWLGFVVHSFFVQYHRNQGQKYLSRITATWDNLLNGSVAQNLTDEDRVHLQKALHSFHVTDGLGLLNVLDVKLGLAFGNLMTGDMVVAEQFLREAYLCNSSAVGELLREFLVAQHRPEEAMQIQ